MQKLWKSVKIWQSYREFTGGPFFETQCRSPCFTASNSQITLMSSWYRYKSLLYNCHASLRLTPPGSCKGTLNSTLQNSAERPIWEQIRQKYTPFLVRNSTILLTLLKHFSMKNAWRHASYSWYKQRMSASREIIWTSKSFAPGNTHILNKGIIQVP